MFGSEEEIWEFITWSFESLQEGKWPSKDWKGVLYDSSSEEGMKAGTELADGKAFYIWFVKGDLDWLVKGLWLRHYNADELCDFCPATIQAPDPGMKAMNFARGSQWKSRLRTPREWRNSARVLHFLFVKFEYLSIWNVECDDLHIKYQGVWPLVLGSILYVIVYQLLDRSPVENMNWLCAQIIDEYHSCKVKVQLHKVELSSFTDPRAPGADFPCLKGRAAEIKHITLPIRNIWKGLRTTGCVFKDGIDACLESMCEMQEITDATYRDVFLDVHEAAKYRRAVATFLENYSDLAVLADAQRTMDPRHPFLFNTIPKMHWMWHGGYKCQYIHPTRSSCCVDEDYMDFVREIVSHSVSGTPSHNVPGRFIEKVSWSMYFKNKFQV